MTQVRVAPQFEAKDILGNTVSLADYRDSHKYVLLVFLRYAGCPWCNLAIYRLSLENSRLQSHKCQVIALVQSEAANIKRNVYDRHTPKPQFPIVPDQQMHIYSQYDVKPSLTGTLTLVKDVPYWLEAVFKRGYGNKTIDGSLFMVPAWFLVNTESGQIVREAKGASFYEHESFLPIYESLTFKD